MLLDVNRQVETRLFRGKAYIRYKISLERQLATVASGPLSDEMVNLQ